MYNRIMEINQLPKAYNHLPEEDRQTILRIAGRLAGVPEMADLLSVLLSALGNSADPVRCFISFERFLNQFPHPQEIVTQLVHQPRAIEILARIFSNSQYLTEVLLRNVNALLPLTDFRLLAKPKSSDRLYSELITLTAEKNTHLERLNALRLFQTGELLRIGVCDLLDLFDLWSVTRQLSNLADALIRISLKLAADEMGQPTSILTVIGMGKLGGRELNYSSDIDLILVTEADPAVALKVATKMINVLDRVTENGFLYRVDMRLRPWGRVGPLVNHLNSHLLYLDKNARPWEKQALLKARVIAGNPDTGRILLERARPLITAGDAETKRHAVDDLRVMTEKQLKQNGIEWGEVKLGSGSIRDIEFTIQYLQMAHGASHPAILRPSTLESLQKLSEAGILSSDENRILSEGYLFQRTIEHFLQIMDYRQTHILPDDPQEQAILGRRLGFDGPDPAGQLVARYEQHVNAIREVYLHFVRNGSTEAKQPLLVSSGSAVDDATHSHLERMTSSYTEYFDEKEIALHAEMAGQLSSKEPARIHIDPLPETGWRLTVVAYDFAGEISVITGLLFVFGLDILSGEAFTYQPGDENARGDQTRKIVDVFYVQPLPGVQITDTDWDQYLADFSRYHQMIRQNKRADMVRELTRRFAARMKTSQPEHTVQIPALYPIELQIDNETSPTETVLRIHGTDTTGFLFELTNALALTGIYIDRLMIETVGTRIHDVLFVTDARGNKIIDPDRQQELRAAAVLIKHFTHLLPYSPNPESALIHFRDFIEQLFHSPEWTRKLVSVEQPEVLQALAKVLGVSDFLWDDFLRMQYTNLFPVVTDLNALSTAKNRDELVLEAQQELSAVEVHNPPGKLAPELVSALTGWRDREMLRIDLRHILGITPEFWDFAGELSDLTEVVIGTLYRLCYESLVGQFGIPYREDGAASRMTVLALGKFGGSEMGFASDIELMFVYDGNGRTGGQPSISTAEFFEKLVELFSKSMHARREGIFQIDLQLRPYGKTGSLAVSLDSFRRYYAPSGPAWSYERQALVRLRPAAGDPDLGRHLEELRDSYLYSGLPFDAVSMWAMRERQLRHLVKAGVYNLKYSLGGLVDLEYLVQGLQIHYGGTYPAVRQTNTRAAMAALADAGILSPDDYTHLRKAHTFLRWMIDSLRVVRGNAKDVTMPPDDSDELAYLARRMRYGDDVDALQRDLHAHQAFVQQANKRLLMLK